MSLLDPHPFVRLERVLGGRDRVLLGWCGVAALAVGAAPRVGTLSDVPLIVVVVGAVGWLWTLLTGLRIGSESETEEILRLYRDGEISLEEMDSRLAYVVDDETLMIREVVLDVLDDVGGVGPVPATRLALEHPTEASLVGASAEELAETRGVSERAAHEIRRELGAETSPVERFRALSEISPKVGDMVSQALSDGLHVSIGQTDDGEPTLRIDGERICVMDGSEIDRYVGERTGDVHGAESVGRSEESDGSDGPRGDETVDASGSSTTASDDADDGVVDEDLSDHVPDDRPLPVEVDEDLPEGERRRDRLGLSTGEREEIVERVTGLRRMGRLTDSLGIDGELPDGLVDEERVVEWVMQQRREEIDDLEADDDDVLEVGPDGQVVADGGDPAADPGGESA